MADFLRGLLQQPDRQTIAGLLQQPTPNPLAAAVQSPQYIGGALRDPQFYADIGSRLADLLRGGVQDVLPTGTRTQKQADRLGMLVDPNYMQKMTDVGLAGMMIGKSAKTWNAADHAKALEMEAKGIDPRIIWKESGNWKGPDGNWRQEIPDNAAALNMDALPQGKSVYEIADWKLGQMPDYQGTKDGLRIGNPKISPKDQDWAMRWADHNPQPPQPVPLQAAFSHDPLTAAYPEMAQYPFARAEGGAANGSFSDKSKLITTGGGQIGRSVGDDLSTTLHEIQHAVQGREGWAAGGSPRALSQEKNQLLARIGFLNSEMSQAAKNLDKYPKGSAEYKLARETFDSAMNEKLGMNPSIVQGDPYTAYRNLAGEAEARATQARIPLDSNQRRALFPADSYDVPLNQLIFR